VAEFARLTREADLAGTPAPNSSRIARPTRPVGPVTRTGCTCAREESGTDSVDRFNALSLESLEIVLHRLERFGGVSFPIGDLARDPQWFPGAV
jgi:hypothetical protein